MEATYCPEDNKLRLYCGRVSREWYERLRKGGYRSTPKQNCDFVATWSPQAEDLAIELIEGDDIGDEDTSPEDRAADRAERFLGYRGERLGEAVGHADQFDSGPQVHGYQNHSKAERAAARHDRQRVRAVSQWSKAEYWQQRTEGVISHALYKAQPRVRRRRIIRLETEARRLSGSPRWAKHLENRIAYERQMMEAEGGCADQEDIQVGGWFGNHQIERVYKSQATGRVVSVGLWGEHAWKTDKHGNPRQCVRKVNIQTLPAGQYVPPTADDIESLKAKQKARKKANPKPKAPPLINPTQEDAERLQAIWNAKRAISYEKEPSPVMGMTQAQYSARSKGDYGPAETVFVNEHGEEFTSYRFGLDSLNEKVFKVRKFCGRFGRAPSVVVLTDKPQKALPWERMAEIVESHGTPESVAKDAEPYLAEFCKSWASDMSEEAAAMLDRLRYHGLAYRQSESQFGLTEEGNRLLRPKQTA